MAGFGVSGNEPDTTILYVCLLKWTDFKAAYRIVHLGIQNGFKYF
jgi:hypothetical protein